MTARSHTALRIAALAWIAVMVLLMATRSRLGPEIDVALDVRRTALDSLHEDARDLKLTIDALGQEVRSVKQNYGRRTQPA